MNDQNDQNESNGQNEPYQPFPEYENNSQPDTTSGEPAPTVDLESELNSSDDPAAPNSFPESAPSSEFTEAEQPVESPNEVAQPQEAPQEPQQNLAPQKSHKGLKITVGVLIVLLLAALGTIAYLLFFQPKDADKTTDTTANTTQNESDDTQNASAAAAMVQKVRDAVSEGLKDEYPTATIEAGTMAPAYKAPSVNYAVGAANKGHSLAITPVASEYDEAGILKTRQLITDVVEADSSLTKTSNDWLITYQNDSLICQVAINGSPMAFSCADISVYADEITKLAPFAKAYLASENGKKYGTGIVMALEKIEEKTDGYKNAWTSMGSTISPAGGFAGIFYYANGQWTYWRGSQSIIECSEYNTRDLQKAFEGDSCYDNTKPEGTGTVVVTL